MDLAFRRAVADARRHGELYFAGLLTEELILNAFGYGKTAFSRVGLHAGGHDLGVSFARPQCGSFVPRGRGGTGGVATRPRLAFLFRQDRRVLFSARCAS